MRNYISMCCYTVHLLNAYRPERLCFISFGFAYNTQSLLSLCVETEVRSPAAAHLNTGLRASAKPPRHGMARRPARKIHTTYGAPVPTVLKLYS